MKTAAHIFAVNGKSNSGDFFLGPATKWRFENIIGEKVSWQNIDVRKRVTEEDVSSLNNYDYLVLGGGGLFLPDTNPNKISCWQWPISINEINKLTPKVYAMSIGWNHFYNQKITMPDRNSDFCDPSREAIFKENVENLISKSELFTMRHNGDCEELKKIVSPDLHEKIKFEFCPVVGYVEHKHKPGFVNKKRYHTFEIKDDRPNRRYNNKTRQEFYYELLEFIRDLLHDGEEIAVMSHDGSSTFYHFLTGVGVPFTFLNNTVAKEDRIIENYSKVKKLYCTAGHSQMTAHALGLDYYSLICHDKLKYFLQDTGNFTRDKYCLINEKSILKLRGSE